jgi:hypothetical protein
MADNVVDLRGPGAYGGCLDCLITFPDAIKSMREANDIGPLIDSMTKQVKESFRKYLADGGDPVKLAIPSVDKLYRNIVSFNMFDIHLMGYCGIVICEFFHQLSCCNVTTFYILNNTMDQLWLDKVTMHFVAAGVKVITPQSHGKDWDQLKKQIRDKVESKQHVAYFEPDATFDHLESAFKLAKELPCVSIYRQLPPEDPQFKIISRGK